MTTQLPTIQDLITNREFIGFCRVWQQDGQCPLPMVDWLMENYGDNMVVGAREAVENELRPMLSSFHDGKYFWQNTYTTHKRHPSTIIDLNIFDKLDKLSTSIHTRTWLIYFNSYEEAIAALLIAYAM